MAKKQRHKKRVAKTTTRKRSRVVVRTRVTKRTTKRTRVTKRTTKRTPAKRTRRKRSEPMIEYSVNVSYRKGSRQASNAISYQMSVFSKPGRSKNDILDAITHVIENDGEDAPRGYTVRIVSWKGGQIPQRVPWSSLKIINSEPATRFHVERRGSH